jgi:predicted CopG family antitoxin
LGIGGCLIVGDKKKKEELLGDILEDIYDKLKFLKDEIDSIKEYMIKLTLQGNDIMQVLREHEYSDIEPIKINRMKNFDKDIYLESLINFLESDDDFQALQDLLDEYGNDITLNQHGES